MLPIPKTYNGLWNQITDFQNLHRAYLCARKGKRFRGEVLEYASNLEENLITTQNELIWHTWEPGRWRQFTVYEPKKRLISAPPFCDRVVHHALVGVVEPLFERKFIRNSYACRVGRGTHAAHEKVLQLLRSERRKHGQVYVLQTDISQYFASVNHGRLLDVVRRTIRDKDVLWLMDMIVRNSGFDGVGLPVGALTSQMFANIFLDQMDHYVTDQLGFGNYIRYMDDTVTIHHSKEELRDLMEQIRRFVEDRLDLRLNPKSQIYPATQGVDFCGYRTWATHTLPRKRNVRRAKRRMRGLMRAYHAGRIAYGTVNASWQSFLGYMKHCSGDRTTRSIWETVREDLRKG